MLPGWWGTGTYARKVLEDVLSEIDRDRVSAADEEVALSSGLKYESKAHDIRHDQYNSEEPLHVIPKVGHIEVDGVSSLHSARLSSAFE